MAGDNAAAAQPTRPANANRTAPANASNPSGPRVQQPKPQALPSRPGASAVLVSARQKGNPILNNIKSVPWEYSDILADYVLGATTCALFLSLKYHRLHPEYIYSRIRALAGKYNLRIILTMVDIPNHEEPLKELSKTSLVNNVTIILCWSAQEAGRYLELFKTYEHTAPTSIRAHQSTSYSDKLVEFITVPRSINKTDAVGLVSNFGSIRTAVNARPEEVSLIAGWGEKKFRGGATRLKKAAKRGITREDGGVATLALSGQNTSADGGDDARRAPTLGVGSPIGVSSPLTRPASAAGATPDADRRPPVRPAESISAWAPDENEEEAMLAAAQEASLPPQDTRDATTQSKKRKVHEDEPSEGVMAALARLRQQT
ncbi:ssDNA endonuclease and repair protein rad10 [Coniosporium tulheliwenetii]|uniref:SsDNA endonuclease and repair protein rad10 n=1 Tax=Coniosporium tulheliwenetii TaxID=3383036 RepID=A0ACC2ZK27_9PEZI|nr:ssDNA endonuclease and repair protein rad10 [Cladosporium sp. JES 115]